MLQLVLDGGSLVQPLHILSPAHWVGVEPTTLRDETSGRTTTPVAPSSIPFKPYPFPLEPAFKRELYEVILLVCTVLQAKEKAFGFAHPHMVGGFIFYM